MVEAVFTPSYPELSVENLLKKMKDEVDVLAHIPDLNEKRKVDKNFIWHVVNHFHP